MCRGSAYVKPDGSGVCDGFAWVGQPITSCDDCGEPAWDHDGQKRSGVGPFHPQRVEPWPKDIIGSWLADGRIDAQRATVLLAVHVAEESVYVLPDKPWPPGPAPLPRCRGCGRSPMAVPRHTETCDAR